MSTVKYTVLMGPQVALPIPATLAQAVKQIEVVHNDDLFSGFQITFTAGRSGLLGIVDYPLLQNVFIKPFNRVKILVTIGALPQMIMDGIITHIELRPSDQPGGDTLVVTGKDIGILMHREVKRVKHSALNDYAIVNKILATYSQYQIIPKVIPPPVLDTPIPIDREPTQISTDFEYLHQLKEKYNYIFYVAPGPVPLTNVAYWGPPVRTGLPQKALTVNMGAYSNVTSIRFEYDALKASVYSGKVQDRATQQIMPLQTFASTRVPLSTGGPLNTKVFKGEMDSVSGLNYSQAQALAQGKTEKSRSETVVARGVLDVTRYGKVLQAHSLVGLRGAGLSYDGIFYVKEVSQVLKPGQYEQSFVLTRDGTGATVPAVPPV